MFRGGGLFRRGGDLFRTAAQANEDRDEGHDDHRCGLGVSHTSERLPVTHRDKVASRSRARAKGPTNFRVQASSTDVEQEEVTFRPLLLPYSPEECVEEAFSEVRLYGVLGRVALPGPMPPSALPTAPATPAPRTARRSTICLATSSRSAARESAPVKPSHKPFSAWLQPR